MEYLEGHAFHFPGLDSLRWQWRIQTFTRPWDKGGGGLKKIFFGPSRLSLVQK